MSTGHDIESRATKYVTDYLTRRGRVVAPRRVKTFDLLVDGVDAEVKAKGKLFAQLDFIGLTKNQFRQIAGPVPFKLFLVCGVNESAPEVFEIDSAKLIGIRPKVERHFYFARSDLEFAMGLRPRIARRPEQRQPLKNLVRAVCYTNRNRWSQATCDVAASDATRILEALLAESTAEEVVHALERQGLRGTSYRYVIGPLIEEAMSRRAARRVE